MSREKTMDEVREEFIERIVNGAIDAAFDPSMGRAKAIEAAVFYVLTTLEGSGDFPYCAVIPVANSADRRFARENGEDWYPGLEFNFDKPVEERSVLRGEDHHMFVAMFREALAVKQTEGS